MALTRKLDFCSVCRNWGENEFENNNGREWLRGFAVDMAEVARAQHEGCLGCDMISRIMEPYNELLKELGTVARLEFDESSNRSFDHVYVCHFGQGSPSTRATPTRNVIATLEVKSVPLETSNSSDGEAKRIPCPWGYLKLASRISGNTGSPEAVHCVRKWLEDCKNNHGSSCRHTEETRLPTRVLKIEGVNKAKLYCSSDESAAYVCLSHCWGKGNTIKTTTLNIHEHLHELCWDMLPKTFQDAISFTHALGLEYLWIDSLCIIQDSAEDWRCEASKMSQIYANSYITLSATKSASAHEGCFATSRKNYISRTMTFTSGSGESYGIHCREPLKRSKMPLNSRGWTLQERLLSKRVIHFMEEEVAWECVNLITCECSSFRHSNNDRGSLKSDVFEHLHAGTGTNTDYDDLVWTWRDIVEEYTRRSLTYCKDTLPALQGLVKLVPSIMGRYLAGHWESTLPMSLCWFISPYELNPSKPRESQEWCAPTWSWASASSPVNLPGPSTRKDIVWSTLVSASVIPLGTDPTGQLLHGEVVLREKCLIGNILLKSNLDKGHAPEMGTGSHMEDASITDDSIESNLQVISNKAESDIEPTFLRSKICFDVKRHTSKYETEPEYYPHWDYVQQTNKHTAIVAMRICRSEDLQYWLLLQPHLSRKMVYERLGMLIVKKDKGSGFEHLDELCDIFAEEMELTIV